MIDKKTMVCADCTPRYSDAFPKMMKVPEKREKCRCALCGKMRNCNIFILRKESEIHKCAAVKPLSF